MHSYSVKRHEILSEYHIRGADLEHKAAEHQQYHGERKPMDPPDLHHLHSLKWQNLKDQVANLTH